MIAPHGGRIEPGTSEAMRAIAGEEFSAYAFEGLKSTDNFKSLHITSHHFDDPRCLELISTAQYVVAVHGCDGNQLAVYLGGLDLQLIAKLAAALRGNGIATYTEGHSFPGREPMNICNRGATSKGVQIELTRALRKSDRLGAVLQTTRHVLSELKHG